MSHRIGAETPITDASSSVVDLDIDENHVVLIDWRGDDDPENPVNWPKKRKWLVTGFACFMCFMTGLNALSLSSAASEINSQFAVSDASFPNSYWTVTAWNGGAALFPLLIMPAMEDFSVRYGYLISYTVFFIFVIPQAVAPNYATLVVSRFFAGGCASVVQNGVENIVTDLWVGDESSLPITLFIFAYLFGFTLGPVVGSSIAQFLHWRWILYIELMLYGSILPVAWLLIRETRGKIILKSRAHDLGTRTGKVVRVHGEMSESILHRLYLSSVRSAYLFFTEPVVFFFTLWCALAIGNVFLATQSILQVFGANYGFNEIQSGYVQATMAVGEVVGLGIAIWQNKLYLQSAKHNKVAPGVPIPEARLQLSIPVSFLCLSGGLFIYAWTSYRDVHWIGPTIGLGLVGVGIMVVVQAAATYITDAYKDFSGSAIAAVAAIENLNSAFLPLAAQSMYKNLGFQWASSLLAFVALALSFAPLVLFLKGPSIRKRSQWMSKL